MCHHYQMYILLILLAQKKSKAGTQACAKFDFCYPHLTFVKYRLYLSDYSTYHVRDLPQLF